MHYETNKIHIIDSMKNAEKEKISALKLEKQRGYTYWSFAAVLILLIFSFFIVKERKKSETLLLNILPKEVAYELKKKGSAEAKYFNQVTNNIKTINVINPNIKSAIDELIKNGCK